MAYRLPSRLSRNPRLAKKRRKYLSARLEALEERRLLTATITVNSTADSNTRDGVLTFREALLVNNGTLAVGSLSAQEQSQVSGSPGSGTNTIAFNFGNSDANHFYYKNDGVAGKVTLANVAVTTTDDASLPTSGPAAVDPDWAHSWFSIRPTSAAPDITHAVTIDGYTQSGASANTNAVGQGLNTVLKVEIDGENAGQLTNGLLYVPTAGTTIRGLVLNGAIGSEVYLEATSSGTIVTGNFIGPDVSGTVAFAFPTISNPPAFLRSSAIYGQEPGSVIGGLTPAARNLISGNNLQLSSLSSAIILQGFGAPSTVQGNIIGPDRTGAKVLGNSGAGILVDTTNVTIGGPQAGAGNVISGNQTASLQISRVNADGTLVQSNMLGTDPTGSFAVGNTGGILAGSNAKIISNVIAFGIGIRVDSQSSGLLISTNSIFSNAGPGIDLSSNGVSLNDVPPTSVPPDQDTGGNNLQNFPSLSSVTAIAGGTRITGTLQSTPSSNFHLEFYANPTRDEDALSNSGDTIAGQFGEGQTYIGSLDGVTDSSGSWNFSVDLPVNLLTLGPGGMPFVTATATDVTNSGSGPANNTSEFSMVAALGGPSFVVTNTGDTGLGTLREAIFNANITPGTQTITFNIPANDPRHFYYQNDGVAGQVSLDHIATTTATDDSAIAGIDPDWAHSWFSIQLASTLPEIIDTVVIDGYSQAGAANTIAAGQNLPNGLNTVLKIELNGANASGDALSLSFGLVGTSQSDAGGSTINGLAINRFGGNGIMLNTLDGGNTVAGNFIGTDISGTIDLGNLGDGVVVTQERGTTIGGDTPANRNLISGNGGGELEILASPQILLEGDLIGTDRTLANAILNDEASTVAFATGGLSTFSRSSGSESVTAQAQPTGGGSLVRMFVGYVIGQRGVESLFNYIDDDDFTGTDEDLGLAISAILVHKFSGLSDHTRPNNPQHSNLVQPQTQAAASDVFQVIDLNGDGVTANDPKDVDSGPNGLQNYPVITSATNSSGTTSITGTLNSNPNASFTIELYSETIGADFRAGEQFLGSTTVTTDANGNANFNFASPISVPDSQFITATATQLHSGTLTPFQTSEFSAPLAVGQAVLTTGVTFNSTTGIMTVVGTANADTIAITPNPNDATKIQVTLNGQVVSKTVALKSITSIDVNGLAGADAITIKNIAKPFHIDGGDDSDTLAVTGKAAANTFSLDGGTLLVNGLEYDLSNLEGLTLIGQGMNDSLTVASVPSIPVTFNGGTGTDTLTGPNATNIWSVTAANTGTLNTGGTNLGFSAVENLVGGTAGDKLNYAAITKAISVNLQTHKTTIPATSGAALTGSFLNFDSFVGGSANDTLIATNQGTLWDIDGANSGTVGPKGFSSFENLTGGTLDDTFQFSSGGQLSGKINGGTGVNTLDISQSNSNQTVNLQTHTATFTGGFTNIKSLVGTRDPLGTTLVGPNTAITWNITGSNAGNVNGLTFSSVANLTGGTMADVFAFADGAFVSGAIDGGKASDTLKYTAYITSVGLNLATGTGWNSSGGLFNFKNFEKFIGGKSFNDQLNGPDTDNVWKVTSENGGTVGAFAFSGVENLSGGSLADRFVLSKGIGVLGSIAGGGGNNTLDYSAYTTVVYVDLRAGIGAMTYHVDSINVVIGGSAGDTLLGTEGRDFLFGGAGADKLDGRGGDDILFDGTTTFGANAATIDSLLTFWNGFLDYATRVAQLRAGTTGVTGLPKFTSTTIKNDTSFDQLTGGAGLDWFFAKLAAPNADQFTDLDTAGGELTN